MVVAFVLVVDSMDTTRFFQLITGKTTVRNTVKRLGWKPEASSMCGWLTTIIRRIFLCRYFVIIVTGVSKLMAGSVDTRSEKPAT